jgi:hypothetical protein
MTRRERLVDAQPEGRIQFWMLLGARARYGSRSFGPAHTIEVQAGQAIECFDLSLTVSESARELQNVEQRREKAAVVPRGNHALAFQHREVNLQPIA